MPARKKKELFVIEEYTTDSAAAADQLLQDWTQDEDAAISDVSSSRLSAERRVLPLACRGSGFVSAKRDTCNGILWEVCIILWQSTSLMPSFIRFNWKSALSMCASVPAGSFLVLRTRATLLD